MCLPEVGSTGKESFFRACQPAICILSALQWPFLGVSVHAVFLAWHCRKRSHDHETGIMSGLETMKNPKGEFPSASMLS